MNVEGAVGVGVRVPALRPDEREAVLLHRRPREGEDLVREEDEERRDADRRDEGDALEEDVAQPDPAALDVARAPRDPV